MKLYLVRHAQRDFGLKFDQLNKVGIEQAKRLGYYFKNKKIDFIYCSINKRAKETLKYILPFLKKPFKITYTSRLRQHNVPEEVGKEAFKILKLKEKIETKEELEKRTRDFWKYLKKKHGKHTILIVSHKQVIKALICQILNLSLDESVYIDKLPSASISTFEFDKKLKTFLIGDLTHLLISHTLVTFPSAHPNSILIKT